MALAMMVMMICSTIISQTSNSSSSSFTLIAFLLVTFFLQEIILIWNCYKILSVLTIFACTILLQLFVEGCKRIFLYKKMYVFVCLYLFRVCIYFTAISAFLGLPRLVMHPKQEIATLVLAAAWCCSFACICVFYVLVAVFCVFMVGFCFFV